MKSAHINRLDFAILESQWKIPTYRLMLPADGWHERALSLQPEETACRHVVMPRKNACGAKPSQSETGASAIV